MTFITPRIARRLSALLLTCLTLTACELPPPRAATQEPAPVEKTYGAGIGIVNHTDRYIYSASVNGGGGGHMSEYGAGIASVCCVVVPVKWRPGLMATVTWNMPIGRKDVIKTKTVEIEPWSDYDSGGDIYIHFFPNDVIRVIKARDSGSSPTHSIPAPVKPAGWKRQPGA